MSHSPTEADLVAQFSTALPLITPQAFSTAGVVYRAVFLKYLTRPNPNALFDRGPMRTPQRFSPPSLHGIETEAFGLQPVDKPDGLDLSPGETDSVFPGLYVAEDYDTAYLEAHQLDSKTPRPTRLQRHLSAVSILGLDIGDTSFQLLDLTQDTVLNTLGMTRRQVTYRHWRRRNMVTNNRHGKWAPTQILGFLAYRDGRFQGIRYPSARNRGKPCIFIFTQRLVRGIHRITVGDNPDCCGLALEAVP